MRALVASLALISTSAFACPQLAGNFTCTYPDGSSEVMSVTQSVTGTVTTYNVNGSQMVADNQVYSIPDDNNVKNASFRSWCDDDITLNGQLLGQQQQNGAYFGDLTMNIQFSLQGANLLQNTDSDVKTDTTDYPTNTQMVCTATPPASSIPAVRSPAIRF